MCYIACQHLSPRSGLGEPPLPCMWKSKSLDADCQAEHPGSVVAPIKLARTVSGDSEVHTTCTN